LTIDPLDKSSDAGLYSCEARGQNGLSARQSLQLNILGKFVVLSVSLSHHFFLNKYRPIVWDGNLIII
jgi:hypothetical protein